MFKNIYPVILCGGYGTRFQEQPTQSPLQQALGAGIASAGIIGAIRG